MHQFLDLSSHITAAWSGAFLSTTAFAWWSFRSKISINSRNIMLYYHRKQKHNKLITMWLSIFLSLSPSSTFFLFHFISIISHYSYFQFTIVSCLCSFNAIHNGNVSIFFQLQRAYLNKNSYKLSAQRITFKCCSTSN